MKIAVIGTGAAGLVAAHKLHSQHDLVVYEASDWIGGHAHTLEVADASGGTVAVDTGFIVFNRTTYPRFCALLEEIGIGAQPSDMSFSVSCATTGLEYEGSGWRGLFAQPTNALRPSFWRMLRDITRFYREAPAALRTPDGELTLGAFLEHQRYSTIFIEKHLIPMASAVWSARCDDLNNFPLTFFVRFFQNHGFLSLKDRPQWLVVPGGSGRYVERLVAPWRSCVRLNTPVASLARVAGSVLVRARDGTEERFDRVVLATHADQALRLLEDATLQERHILGAFAYQPNDVALHCDASMMPKSRRAWASWNYHLGPGPSTLPTVTYWMNRLQSLDERQNYFVTLNRTSAIAPSKISARLTYHHPVYSRATFAAQRRHAEIDGVHGVHFCGAYWGYGFHEDAVRSAETVVYRMTGEVLA